MCKILKVSESGYYRWLKNRKKKTKRKLHHMENVITKLNSSGISVPSELLKQVKFIDGEAEAR